MKPLLVLWGSLFISILFLLVPDTGEIGFPYSDQVLTARTWFYFMFEHLVLVIIAIAIVMYEKKYRLTAWLFLGIHVVDTVDYCLTYANPWFTSDTTFNTIKIATFGVSIAFDIVKTIANGRTVEANK